MKRMIRNSYDPTEADLYVIKIWYEVDPGYDVAAPEAAEEIIRTVATSPDAALEQAKMQWNGPIDRIEIVDINPEEGPDDISPLEYSTDVSCASETSFETPMKQAKQLINYIFNEGADEHDFVLFLLHNMPAAELIELLNQYAEQCDIDLHDFYN